MQPPGFDQVPTYQLPQLWRTGRWVVREDPPQATPLPAGGGAGIIYPTVSRAGRINQFIAEALRT